MGAQQRMALARMSSSRFSVFPAFKNNAWILPVPENPTKRDGHRLSLTTAGQRAEMSSALPKSPLTNTVWGLFPLILPDFGPYNPLAISATFPV